MIKNEISLPTKVGIENDNLPYYLFPQFLRLYAVLKYEVNNNHQSVKHTMKHNKSSLPQIVSRNNI